MHIGYPFASSFYVALQQLDPAQMLLGSKHLLFVLSHWQFGEVSGHVSHLHVKSVLSNTLAWQHEEPVHFPNGSTHPLLNPVHLQLSHCPFATSPWHEHYGIPLSYIFPVKVQHFSPTHTLFRSEHFFNSLFHWQLSTKFWQEEHLQVN